MPCSMDYLAVLKLLNIRDYKNATFGAKCLDLQNLLSLTDTEKLFVKLINRETFLMVE